MNENAGAVAVQWMRSVAVSVLLMAFAAAQAQPADALWSGGPIITVNDAQPAAEAVAVRGGRIIAVGPLATLERTVVGPGTVRHDLGGRALLPGFIDAHGHLTGVGFQAMVANLLPPPDGVGRSIAALQQALREWMQAQPWHREYGIILGFGYDDSQLSEQRHPTRDELDAVSTELPVVVVHQSSHLGVYNSAALSRLGITAATPDPQGGVIRRRADSREPDGRLEETAHFAALMRLMPALQDTQRFALLRAGQALYLRYGHTTAQDGRTSPSDLAMLQRAAAQGVLALDLVSYPDLALIADDPVMSTSWVSRQYSNGLRIGGVKLALDGSPQGRTAWLSTPYFKPPPGQPPDYAGYPAYRDDAQVTAAVERAFRAGWQVLAHTNGDAAIDQFLNAVAQASAGLPAPDRRPVMIHGQTLRRDQVERLQSLGIFPSLFPMHTYYWGDWHRDTVLGPERARHISPTGWLVERSMRFSSHHDAPVAFPDTLRVLSATVNRTTRTGQVLGPEHRVEPIVAIKALTLWAAYQHFEEDSKGSIEPGKLADFVVLSDNPITVARDRIDRIRVLETVKGGRSVWRQEDAPRAEQGCAHHAPCRDGMGMLERRLAFYAALQARRDGSAQPGGLTRP